MRKRTKRVLGSLALAAGAVGAAGAFLKKKKKVRDIRQGTKTKSARDWARPGMTVTFRAELMPGRDRTARTMKVKKVLPSGRVLLHEIDGEHAEKEFDPVI